MSPSSSPPSPPRAERAASGALGHLRLADLLRELGPASVALPAKEADLDLVISGVHHDSRRVSPGDLFVARDGGRVSGLDYLGEARARGAVAVLAGNGVDLAALGLPAIGVDDVPLGLAKASSAVYGHPTFGLEVIGVTGTNGKTTTALLCQGMLNGSGLSCGVIGTLGASFGGFSAPSVHTSPEADELARLCRRMKDDGATHIAMEVSSIALTAKRMDAVRFRVAAFTNLTQDHLDFHGSMESYGAAKARLFFELEPATSVIHIGDEFGLSLARDLQGSGRRALTYGRSPSADVQIIEELVTPYGLAVSLRTPVGPVKFESHLVGSHNVENLTGAAVIGIALGLSPAVIESGLSAPVSVPGRLERCDDPQRDDLRVFVDYAHTPDALVRVLQSLRPLASSELVCVFGCGGDRDADKRPLMGDAVGQNADRAVLTTDNPRSEDPEAIAAPTRERLSRSGIPHEVILDRRQAILEAIGAAPRGAVILIAGKGHETYQIIGPTQHPFDDREVAREALRARRNSGKVSPSAP